MRKQLVTLCFMGVANVAHAELSDLAKSVMATCKVPQETLEFSEPQRTCLSFEFGKSLYKDQLKSVSAQHANWIKSNVGVKLSQGPIGPAIRRHCNDTNNAIIGDKSIKADFLLQCGIVQAGAIMGLAEANPSILSAEMILEIPEPTVPSRTKLTGYAEF